MPWVDLLEAEESLVGTEGPHQRCHSCITDGIALQAADRGWGTLGMGSQDLEKTA